MQLPNSISLLLTLSLGLANTASAIDAYFHLGANCDGPSIVCSNLNPGVCCSDGRTKANTIGFRGIPTDWVIAAKAYGGYTCSGSASGREVSRNTNFLCVRARFGEPLGSTRYDFGENSKKARRGRGWTEKRDDGVEEECQKPDQLVLGDGVTSFDLAGLEDGVVEELLKLASEGDAIPEEYHSRKL